MHAKTNPLTIPVEIEIYVNPDGSVTFADLEEQTLAIVKALNPDHDLACASSARPIDSPDVNDTP
jgi:hypothetical protein